MGTNYYVRVPACENPCIHCRGSELIHLGKSAHGWSFLFRAYPKWEDSDRGELGQRIVDDYASWLQLLDLGTIEDETGRPCTSEELIARIDSKRGGQGGLLRDGSNFYDADGNYFSSYDFT